MSTVSHIGIAVSDLEKSIKLFSKILGCQPESIEEVVDQKVKVAIFRPGGKDSAAIELICPIDDSSPVRKYLNKTGEGLHHISLKVDDLADRLQTLKNENIKLIDETPRNGAEGKKIAFLHPSSTSGVLIELEQE